MNKAVQNSGWPLVLLAVLAAGCEEPGGPVLHRLPSYAGTVRFTAEGGREQSCDLAFHRGNGNFQARFVEDDRVVTLVRGADQVVTAFEDAAERPATAAERERFRVVASLVDSSALEAVRPGAKAYRAKIEGVWYRVQLESQTGTRIHGEPR